MEMEKQPKTKSAYRPAWMRDAALRSARTCYDHLAGQLGVALAESLVERGYLRLDPSGGDITPHGDRFFAEFGLDLSAVGARRRRCRSCLDWSERRPHLGGAIGAALARRCFAQGWIERIEGSRVLRITDLGRCGFSDAFGIVPP